MDKVPSQVTLDCLSKAEVKNNAVLKNYTEALTTTTPQILLFQRYEESKQSP